MRVTLAPAPHIASLMTGYGLPLPTRENVSTLPPVAPS